MYSHLGDAPSRGWIRQKKPVVPWMRSLSGLNTYGSLSISGGDTVSLFIPPVTLTLTRWRLARPSCRLYRLVLMISNGTYLRGIPVECQRDPSLNLVQCVELTEINPSLMNPGTSLGTDHPPRALINNVFPRTFKGSPSPPTPFVWPGEADSMRRR